ncbi:MAG: hypothetical protein IJ658_09645 [Kiritimatiellae bacterium]|nr:hypothetical protein [Kiritimatiellia bacterium]
MLRLRLKACPGIRRPTTRRRLAVLGVFVSGFCASLAVPIPQAPVITYGLVRDAYGTPLTAAAGATMRLVRSSDPDGRVYAEATVGDTGFPGMNYRLSLEIDSEGPSRPYAVTFGTSMRIQCLAGGAAQALSPSPVFRTPLNGTAQRKDFSLGGDADGDGMPDEWEAWILDVNGRPSDAAAVAAFRPDGDADGDGMTNYQEYLAGTNPFEATDLLAITSFRKLEGTDRVEIRFTTVPGRTYRIVKADALDAPVWAPVATTRVTDGAPAYETYAGTGRVMTVYADAADAPSAFFRVAAN